MIRQETSENDILLDYYQPQNIKPIQVNQIKQNFTSIQKLVKVPPIKKLLKEQSPIPAPEMEFFNNQKISNYLKKSTIDLIENLRTQFFTYENVPNFQFYFPESKFPAVAKGQRNNISYAQKNIVQEQNTFKDRLSDQQIQDIQESGQFKVKSSKQWVKLPYIWKMNQTFFKGRIGRQKSWNQNLNCVYSLLEKAWTNFSKNLPEQIFRIIKWPTRLFSLFFGKKAITIYENVDYGREVAKQFWLQVMQKYYVQCKQWGSFIWNYLDAGWKAQFYIVNDRIKDPIQYKKEQQNRMKAANQYDNRLQQSSRKIGQINKVSQQFEQVWNKMKKNVIKQAQEQIQKKYPTVERKLKYQAKTQLQKQEQNRKQEQLKQNLAYSKYRYYTNYLSKNLPKKNVPTNVIESILIILNLMFIITRKQDKITKRMLKQKHRIQRQVKQNHPIRSLNSHWYNEKVEELYKPKDEELTQQFLRTFIDDQLIKKMNYSQVKVFQLWLQYRKNYDAKIKMQKQKKQELYMPKRIFKSSYALLPPYAIFKHESGTIDQPQYYYKIIKEREEQVTTFNHCWKFYLYCMRLKCWTINCLVMLFYSCWQGMFGIRCLFGIDQFVYDQEVNYTTGQYIDYKRKPILGHFIKVLNGISKSRAQFQGLPDTGLFGKNCSRLCNLLECYVFRFLIVGILLNFILYPIAILVVSSISFLLIITVWAWIPIVLLITYLFNIMVFQFESSWRPTQCYIRLAPFLSLVISLIFSFVKCLFYFLSLIPFAPLLSLIVLFFACLSICLRAMWDCLMLFFIKHLGRTPSRDTIMAKKISGPGMSKSYYMSINQEDLYILIQSQLQKIYMSQLWRITMDKLNYPISYFNNTMKTIIGPLLLKNKEQQLQLMNVQSYYNYKNYNSSLNPSYNSQQITNQSNLVKLDKTSVIYTSCQNLTKQFTEEYTQFILRYPARPYNIRFTQDQINSYFENTLSIVKSFINKNNSSEWIYGYFDLNQNDLEQLTRKLWINVFQCGEQIFEPLEQVDQRFKLQDMYKNDDQQDYGSTYLNFSHKKMQGKVHQVMQALEGQVDLKPRVPRVGHYKHKISNHQIPLYKTEQLFNSYKLNSNGSVNILSKSPKQIFFANLSIKQKIKLQQYNYQKTLQKYQKQQQGW